ncbi:hypothetical protein MSAN_01186900 [Mycena sanguinolenta]|uniref:RING-type domain-containing protein n=1 Tax=Mycena sanguinolenta TaxID=230812 RepID=A0A8H6YHW0_9AGAR|nr:hypothetical protein MSAN_01186900 [Mycena sanguinolenta]
MRSQQPPDDISLPSPLTSRNLRPRSETRLGSARRRLPVNSPISTLPTTSMASTNALAGPSSRPHKRGRDHSGPAEGLGVRVASKRVRRMVHDEEERGDEEEIDELADDDDTADLRAMDASAEAQEDEVEAILRPGAHDGDDDLRLGENASRFPAKRGAVSSASLARILHVEDDKPVASSSKSSSKLAKMNTAKKRSQSPQLIIDSPREFTIASTSKLVDSPPSSPILVSSTSPSTSSAPAPPTTTASSQQTSNANLEPLSAYTCPICFFPPTNATLTPCGHVCCGSCLFTAVKTMLQRAGPGGKDGGPRCPVCRAPIPGWDGHGGGVIGLKVRAVFSL